MSNLRFMKVIYWNFNSVSFTFTHTVYLVSVSLNCILKCTKYATFLDNSIYCTYLWDSARHVTLSFSASSHPKWTLFLLCTSSQPPASQFQPKHLPLLYCSLSLFFTRPDHLSTTTLQLYWRQTSHMLLLILSILMTATEQISEFNPFYIFHLFMN